MIPARLLSFLAAALLVAPCALQAAPRSGDAARIASDFAGWAGGRQNAQSLVSGLHAGSSITIATTGPGRHVSLAGFTPSAPMDYDEVRDALAAARKELARRGVRQPTAEQVQAALIGGEIEHGGRRQMLPGVVAVRGGNPQLAVR